jgi:thioesterase domain-containing protein
MYIKYWNLTYKYTPEKFDGNILLFRSTENPFSLKYLGWENLVNDIRLVEIDGKHLEIFIGKDRSEILRNEIERHLIQVDE